MIKKVTTLIISALCFSLLAFGQGLESHGMFDSGPGNPQKVLKVYPVPATTQINFQIQNSNGGTYEIIVYNFLGRKLDDLKNVSSTISLNLDSYYSGIYIYQLRDQRGTLVDSGKFNVIKQ